MQSGLCREKLGEIAARLGFRKMSSLDQRHRMIALGRVWKLDVVWDGWSKLRTEQTGLA